jgi:hypothetical protein
VNDGAADAAHIPKDVDVLEAKEVWSEYRLADGTVLRIKPVMIAVARVEGELVAALLELREQLAETTESAVWGHAADSLHVAVLQTFSDQRCSSPRCC